MPSTDTTSDASIHDRIERLETRVADLESENETLRETVSVQNDRIDTQREQIETQNDRINTQRERIETLEAELEETRTENDRREALARAALKKAGANKARIAELQTRELEKGAHLRADHVDPDALEDQVEYLERFTRDDDVTCVRVPDADDPLDRGDSIGLSHADLLPIQQLARMDDDMLRSTTNALPSRLAAKLWRARADPDVGDDPWRTGCKTVREYVTAGDMKHWIRRQERGISDAYAKKLVSRTIDALLEFSNNRLAVRRTTERKNGLSYTERRVLVKTDASIPGERTVQTDSPGTADVHG
ncbi:hypothetical protein [Natrinema caseinilyticum]|uniref:hypothetical protein n=1 Tax=Natrinema caseinilyticum TaxID=2961570 RepID=UPI0020C35409|nr:hypothetical protein [Natrinema caseinilyticum]